MAPWHQEGSEGVVVLLPPTHCDTDSRPVPIADLYRPGGQEKPWQLPAPAMTIITAKSVILVMTESLGWLLQP